MNQAASSYWSPVGTFSAPSSASPIGLTTDATLMPGMLMETGSDAGNAAGPLWRATGRVGR